MIEIPLFSIYSLPSGRSSVSPPPPSTFRALLPVPYLSQGVGPTLGFLSVPHTTRSPFSLLPGRNLESFITQIFVCPFPQFGPHLSPYGRGGRPFSDNSQIREFGLLYPPTLRLSPSPPSGILIGLACPIKTSKPMLKVRPFRPLLRVCFPGPNGYPDAGLSSNGGFPRSSSQSRKGPLPEGFHRLARAFSAEAS